MQSLKIFDEFRLDRLDEEWIDFIWRNEFLTFKDIPDDYTEQVSTDDLDILLKDSYFALNNWINSTANEEDSDERSQDVSWQTLVAFNLNTKALLSILGYSMYTGQLTDANEDARLSCFRATSLYFALLRIPGSTAFQVFHANLYNRALNTFKLSELLVDKNRKRRRARLDTAYENYDEMELDEREKRTLVKGINGVMFDLTQLLQNFWLQDQPRSLEITVHSLLQVVNLATDSVDVDRDTGRPDPSINSLVHNAYSGLELLCKDAHGSVNTTIHLIAKYMLPNLLCNQAELLPRELSATRNCTVNFLKSLLRTHSSEAHTGVTTLIQHLMVKFPERAEPRQKQAVMVTKLVDTCQEVMYAKAIHDLVVLAHHSKIANRIFAQEIIAEFLVETLLDHSNLLFKMKSKKLLLATVLSRCRDSSSLVRSKAMATIAESTAPRNNVALTTIQEIFEGAEKNKPLPNVDELKRAVFEDTDPLPGSRTIISIVIARLEDDRAHVRRNAVQTLGNLVALFAGLLDEAVSALGSRCRDPAMTVRSHAVHILTQILEQFPEHASLVKEWVQTVLPLVFDVEAKVQEKVLDSLRRLVVDQITLFSIHDRDSINSLPWAILEQILQLKMRKHLYKACAMWEKSSVITSFLVKKIQSYLGTEHDIGAWMLLAAISTNRELPQMSQHFGNYDEYLCGTTLRANLALKVLNNSWTMLDEKSLTTLRADLFKCLSNFRITVNLISTCCDIFAKVTLHLNPANGEQLVKANATELMKLAEEELECFFDNVNVAEEETPIYLKAMCTLGHASHLCTETISPGVLRTLQGLVLEWNTLPDSLRSVKELRAAAVTVLGQQALRDREIAEEVMPILGRMMGTNVASVVDAAAKVNAAKALADICVRFTALVEPYLPEMCASMKDANPVVREAIVVLFIQLLLEDFVKVKGPFFFHILTMLTDSDEMVRELTVFLVNERLLAKNKNLVSRQFLESIFHYNDYKLRDKFVCDQLSERERIALTLPKQENQTRRRLIYNFMLEHLDPPGKLKLLTSLTREVLAGAIHGNIDLNTSEGACVLKDVLYVLSRDEMQPSSCNKQVDDDGQDEGAPSPQSSTNNATNVIVEGMKRFVVAMLLPTLIRLKRKLVKKSSPVAGDVIKYYLKIVQHHTKEQLSSLYHEDPKMETEIQNDLRKYARGKTPESEEETPFRAESTPNAVNHALIMKKCTPRIVLRRLSSLTYPGIANWRSPSQSSNSGERSPLGRSSGSQSSLASPSYSSGGRSPTSSQAGPSETPKMRLRRTRRSPNYSPIPVPTNYLLKRLRQGRVSAISEDDDEYSEDQH